MRYLNYDPRAAERRAPSQDLAAEFDRATLAAWRNADCALSRELQRLFGARAGDARYDATRKGWSALAIRLGAEFQELGEQAAEIYARARANARTTH